VSQNFGLVIWRVVPHMMIDGFDMANFIFGVVPVSA
jgi:hypothetical protein